jgi:hypothetical protein
MCTRGILLARVKRLRSDAFSLRLERQRRGSPELLAL